jgi:hypothetical protein
MRALLIWDHHLSFDQASAQAVAFAPLSWRRPETSLAFRRQP